MIDASAIFLSLYLIEETLITSDLLQILNQQTPTVVWMNDFTYIKTVNNIYLCDI